MRPAAVVASGLRRSVGGRRLLDGVDLRVPVGARLLLVSEPDEAASLLLRIMAGLVRPAGGSFDLAGRLADYDAAERLRRIDAAIEQFRLGPGLDRPVSRGGSPLAERVALAAAMLTDPEVLLLDDPLRSIDPAERARLLAVPGKRRTVVLASRYPASEEGLVNQVALLLNGRLAIHARRDDLEAQGLPLTLKGIASLAVMRTQTMPRAAGA